MALDRISSWKECIAALQAISVVITADDANGSQSLSEEADKSDDVNELEESKQDDDDHGDQSEDDHRDE